MASSAELPLLASTCTSTPAADSSRLHQRATVVLGTNGGDGGDDGDGDGRDGGRGAAIVLACTVGQLRHRCRATNAGNVCHTPSQAAHRWRTIRIPGAPGSARSVRSR